MTEILDQYQSAIYHLTNQPPIEGAEYYEISKLADEAGKMFFGTNTHWVGFSETKPKREIREASIVDAVHTINLYKLINRPLFVVNTEDELTFFLYAI